MSRARSRAILDWLGAATSGVCALHCALTPLVLAALPLAARQIISSALLEWMFVAVSLVLGLGSLGHAYRAVHGRASTLVLFLCGLLLLVLARAMAERAPRLESAGVFAGAALLVGAHVLNLALCRRCQVTGPCGCASEGA
jgi:hypothetical protein